MNEKGHPPAGFMPVRLINRIRHYDWGSRDERAYIPKLLGMSPEKGRPYAELWIGAHPKAPSRTGMEEPSMPLDAWIARNPQAVLGPSVAARFKGLPFLLKVISAAEPLSIQAHPDRKLAEKLHTANPAQYPDGNHKPEIAIALDGLSALAGIQPFPGLKRTAARYPEIAALLPEAAGSGAPGVAENPRQCFLDLLSRSQAEPSFFAGQINRLRSRLKSSPGPDETEALFIDLADRYDATDAGLACLFLMNRMDLSPGQAVFLPAGVPHTYLKGNIVECMANSDNVVRLGLTRKFIDLPVWKELLPENPTGRPVLNVPGPREDHAFETPAEEFRISRYELETGMRMRIMTGNSLEILLLISGRLVLRPEAAGSASPGCTIDRGQAWLIPGALPACTVEPLEPCLLFRVRVPQNGR